MKANRNNVPCNSKIDAVMPISDKALIDVGKRTITMELSAISHSPSNPFVLLTVAFLALEDDGASCCPPPFSFFACWSVSSDAEIRIKNLMLYCVSIGSGSDFDLGWPIERWKDDDTINEVLCLLS